MRAMKSVSTAGVAMPRRSASGPAGTTSKARPNPTSATAVMIKNETRLMVQPPEEP
jgi:hypothetical protein